MASMYCKDRSSLALTRAEKLVAVSSAAKVAKEEEEEEFYRLKGRVWCTAGIISLLTHICICVVLNILVHAQLTYGHQSPCH